MRKVATLGSSALIAAVFLFSCGHHSDDDTSTTSSDAALVDRARLAAPVVIDASNEAGPCTVTITSPPLEVGVHVPVGSTITSWDSNPPSSGPHYPIWAAFQEYTDPVPRGYYVHDLEHGAIDFLYNCPSADGEAGSDEAGAEIACPDVVAGFRSIVAALPDDPLCDAADDGVRVRTVITPDPLIPNKVAAVAWGWVYLADCLDVPSLTSFALAHYGQGPELLCAQGQTVF